MRVLELFGGYGSQALALENLGIEFKSDLCEIDKYAIQAYNQIHGETFNYGDICSIDETKLPYYDLITYSSPCQDFSQAGKQAGGEKGSGTRSSLLWECERIIRAVKPKYLLMENVKALTSKKFMPLFAKWLNTLEELGYKNWWKVLNAKDYGVPQNRERVFVVSILGGGKYQFPDPIPLTKRLKDVLEQNVDEKYYINNKSFEKTNIQEPVCCASRGRNPDNPSDRTTGCPTEQRLEINTNGTTNTITTVQKDNYIIEPMALDEQNQYIRKDGCVGTLTTDGSSPKHNNRVIEPKVINPLAGKSGYGWHFEQEVYDEKGIARAVKAGGGSGNIPKVMQEPINLYPNSGNPQAGRIYNTQGISPAMDTCQGGNRMPKITEQYRIRKLTPRECWRLMGVRDYQFDKLHDISNSQLYKMAGNSIVVDVLMGIFKNMFMQTEQKGQLELL